jgi:hypothetical protein
LNKSADVSIEDIQTFYKFVFKRNSKQKTRSWTRGLINLLIWFILAAGILTVIKKLDFSFFQLHWPTAFVVAIAFFIFIVVFIIEFKMLSKASMPTKDGLIIGHREIELSAEGISETTALSTNFFKWAAVDEVALHNKNVYVFFDTALALILPSSSFFSDEARNNFVARIEKLRQL